MERAISEADDWQKKLETTGDPGLRPIASDLRELKELLAAEETFDDPTVGRKLLELGERAQAVAVSGTATPVADKLQLLSHLLTEEGRSILEGSTRKGDKPVRNRGTWAHYVQLLLSFGRKARKGAIHGRTTA